MSAAEDVGLLKAALAVAMADGELMRSEKGVVQGLARRIGVGRASFEAMLAAAEEDDSVADNILMRSKVKACTAFELLVAQARIDGEISAEERSLLVRIATSLGITGDEFAQLYQAAIKRADDIRKSRKGPA
jgi:tellurite resistance protein